jgi:hypothetical protein
MAEPNASAASEDQTQADIARANKAWTDEDVKSSQDYMTRAHGGGGARPSASSSRIVTPTLMMNPSQTQACVEVDQGIREYWQSSYGTKFSTTWRGMTRQARQRLLQTVGPEMARNSRDPEAYGQLLLIPELVVDRLSTNGNALLEVIESIMSTDLANLYRKDDQRIRILIQQRQLDRDPSRDGVFHMLVGDNIEHVGAPMRLNMQRMRETGTEAKIMATFMALMQAGTVLEGAVFGHVMSRRFLLLQTVALLLDEMRTEVFDKNSPMDDAPIMRRMLQCSREGCTNTKFTDSNGKQEPLKLCTRCRGAAYCSRDCQVTDWKKRHKQFCGKPPS